MKKDSYCHPIGSAPTDNRLSSKAGSKTQPRPRLATFLVVLVPLWTASFAPAETEPVVRFLFAEANIEGTTLKAVQGGVAAEIAGPIKFKSDQGFTSLLLDKEANKISVPAETVIPLLPKKEITVEACLAIEKTVEWNGILGVATEEKGWMLGASQSNFSFTVSGKDTPGTTQLRALDSLEWGEWYHVAGTYDGKEIRVYVNGDLVNSSTAQQGELDYPEGAPLVIGSFDKFFPQQYLHEVTLYHQALTPEEIKSHYDALQADLPKVERVAVGPYLRRLDGDKVLIGWETSTPTPSIVAFGRTLPLERRIEDRTPKTVHEVLVDGIERPHIHYYRLIVEDENGRERSTRLFDLDSSFDTMPIEGHIEKDPFPQDEWSAVYSQTAERILDRAGWKVGYCVVVGCEQGRLAFELAKRSKMQIVCLDDNEENIRLTRKNLDAAGLYGVQVSAHLADLKQLPLGNYLANLIVSDRALCQGQWPSQPDELYRVLRPYGGVIEIGQPAGLPEETRILTRESGEAWLVDSLDAGELTVTQDAGTWIRYRRGALPGSGAWTHQYADAGNSSCSQDPYAQGDMEVLWFGRPGPRSMVDRGTRSPAPLSVAGHLFVQGDSRMFGLDAYNGTLQWILELPNLRRANIPRDSSNMTADENALYLAIQNQCWVLDPDTGNRTRLFEVSPEASPSEYDWGYIARQGDLLFGSAVKRGSLFIGADGEWYDQPNEESAKVLSDDLFALDPKSGERKWTYRGGLIINPTIALGDGTVYFVETRSPRALARSARRLPNDEMTDHFLVALEAATGAKKWERPIEIEGAKWVYYLAYASDTLVLLGTTDQYHLHAFDAGSGAPLWNQTYGLRRNHHGGAMQHPAIIGDTIYTDSRAFALRTGEILLEDEEVPPRRGCGTISGAARSVFYRHHYHTVWDLDTGTFKEYEGIRTGCWLGIIPAGGLVLAPESSSGCQCTEPIQTSIAFLPTP